MSLAVTVADRAGRHAGHAVDLCSVDFCFLKKLSGVRKLTTFYLAAKNDHRLVTFISLKTINSDLQQEGETGGRRPKKKKPRAYFVVPLTREAAEGTTLKLGPECLGEYSGRDLS